MEYYDFRAMNSDIVLAAEGEAGDINLGFMATRAYIAAEEMRFTRFSPVSELSRLNQSAGAWFDVSSPMLAVLQEANALVNETGGLFNPCVLDALEAAGYDRSMDMIRAAGASSEPDTPIPIVPEQCQIEIDEGVSRVRLPRGARIDLGGIAKGWIAESAANVLAQHTIACAVNAGGDLFAIGVPTGVTAWNVALEDPRDPEAVLGVLRVGPGAVTTSSITKRSWVRNGHLQHHLIDPRTGLPAQTDWLSVTVIAPSAAVAEVYAKSLLIAGSYGAKAIAARRKELEFIAVDGQGQMWGSDRAKEYLDVEYEGAINSADGH